MASPALPPAVNAFLSEKLQNFEFAFTVSDALAADMPICYASCAFYELTGYGKDEVIGKNCRFLQGPDTERRMVMEIRDSIREDRSCQVCLLNYKKNGQPFWNQLFLCPIFDDQGRATHYVGIQTDVSSIVASTAAQQQQQQALSIQQAALHAASDPFQAASVETTSDVSTSTQAGDLGTGQVDSAAAEVVQLEAEEASMVQRIIEQEHCSSSSQLPCSLLQPLMRIQQSFVLSDPNLPDNPIVHASEHFLALTGYPREEVVGRNCRFLQGPGTDRDEVARMRDALSAVPPRAVTVTLLNYRKDGTPFWNALHCSPIRDADGRVMFHIGVQLDVSMSGGGDGLEAGPLAVVEECGATEAAVAGRPCKLRLAHKCAHMSATGAARVAVRSLSGQQGGLRRSIDNHTLPQRGCSRSLSGASGASNSFDYGSRRLSSGSGAEQVRRSSAGLSGLGAVCPVDAGRGGGAGSSGGAVGSSR